MASRFVPRASFPELPHLPRSYFLGHHRSALEKLKTAVSDTDVVIELRDYRVPLTSINPQFEEALSGIRRWIVYSKADLGQGVDATSKSRGASAYEKMLAKHHNQGNTSFFISGLKRPFNNGVASILKSLEEIQEQAAIDGTNLTGIRLLVVGMPNIGKSTLMNKLHARSMQPKNSSSSRTTKTRKIARTEMKPGTTRSFSEYVKILAAGTEKKLAYAFPKPAVYLRDTPGVFVPFVPDSEAMLKLALVGCIKTNVIPSMVLADYLLYQMNLHAPSIYTGICPPTNEVTELCEAYAHRHQRMLKGGEVGLEAAAEQLVTDFQHGEMGRFVLDDLSGDALQAYDDGLKNNPPISKRKLVEMGKAAQQEIKRQKYHAKTRTP